MVIYILVRMSEWGNELGIQSKEKRLVEDLEIDLSLAHLFGFFVGVAGFFYYYYYLLFCALELYP